MNDMKIKEILDMISVLEQDLKKLSDLLVTDKTSNDDRKYEFTDETILFCGKTLHRIKALRDFGDVHAGDLGGFIEKEENLSHEGNCWVYYNARVFDDAKVYGNAWVCGNDQCSVTLDYAVNAQVFGNAQLFDDVVISGND